MVIGMARQFAWVIERETSDVSRPEYYTGRPNGNAWSFDDRDARRFARLIDGESMRQHSRLFDQPNAHRVCEHGWG
jgi:hypothetical protein